MGLIKSLTTSVSTILGDQWKEYFYCDSLGANTLVAKGQKHVSGRSSNTKGSENIISNGSTIAVNDGQCMIIVDQGKIAEFSCEPGVFTYDTSSEPSLFSGKLGQSIVDTFKTIGKRFTYGGDTAKDQRVYYINLKEIPGNKYGTPTPVPFRVIDKNIGLDVDISIRCNGEYSYKIVDPLLFYKNVTGNVTESYTRDRIDSMLKTELLTALQPAFAKISAKGIRYSELPGHTLEISDALNDVLSTKWSGNRGLAVCSFGINSVAASEADEKMIKEAQMRAINRDPGMAAATLVTAQAQAMQDAAKNQGAGGAMFGFAGMNMAQNAGGMNAQNLFAMSQAQAQAQAQTQAAPSANTWTCECGATNTGKFCMECGKPKPENDGWFCPECGQKNTGKFCSNCGTKKPEAKKTYKCNKCGWEPEDKTNPPKFCPNCGDRFDENDAK